jgi:hypothetical protein
VSFSRSAAIAFVESCWELIDDDPDVWFWSECFIESSAAISAAIAEVGYRHAEFHSRVAPRQAGEK